VIFPWGLNRSIPVIGVDGDGLSAARDWKAVREFQSSEEGRRLRTELVELQHRTIDEAGGIDALIATYSAANSPSTQDVFRRMYRAMEAKAGHILEGALIGHWAQRNQGMFKRTLEAMELHEASRVILPVGGAHKYALDELFADVPGLRVLQLDDFLTTPLNLSESELLAFRKGESPISYPSNLMFIHRKIHGGEPNAYTLDLPDDPDSIDTGPLSERIDACLAADPRNTNMLYYRGILHYLRREYCQAIDDFRAVAQDRRSRISVSTPIWEMGLLREGQMHDILGEREEALACYRRVRDEGSGLVLEMAEPYLEKPFERSNKAKQWT